MGRKLMASPIIGYVLILLLLRMTVYTGIGGVVAATNPWESLSDTRRISELIQISDLVIVGTIQKTKLIDTEAIPEELLAFSHSIECVESEIEVLGTLKGPLNSHNKVLVRHYRWKSDIFLSNVPKLFSGLAEANKIEVDLEMNELLTNRESTTYLILLKQSKEEKWFEPITGHRQVDAAFRKIE